MAPESPVPEVPSSRSRSWLFWGGQSLSVVCDQGWVFLWTLILVDILGANESWFGAANALQYITLAVIPLFLTPLFARRNLFNIMSRLDLARAVVTALVVVGLLFHWLNLGWAFVMIALISSLAGLFQSAFYAVLPDVAGSKENLARGNARLSILISVGGVVMPVVGAALTAVASPAWTLAIVAFAYAVSCVTLHFVSKEASTVSGAGPQVNNYLAQMRRGLRVVVSDRLVGTAAGLATTFNVVAGMAATIVPTLILTRWELSPQLFGVFTAAAAVGGIIGGLVAGHIVNRLGVARSLWAATAAAAVVFAAMGVTVKLGPDAFAVLVVLEGLIVLATVVFNVANGTLRHLVVPRDLLAQTFTTVRVVASLGSALGAALGGFVATLGGSMIGLMIAGARRWQRPPSEAL